MTEIKTKDVPLDQFDNFEGDYMALNTIPKSYRDSVGFFIILFSALEHCVNNEIADHLSDRAHETGYRVASTLTMKGKVDFLHNLLLRIITTTGQNKKTKLKEFKKRLTDLNTFRNYIAHANWGTLKKDGFVRTKILVDSSDGLVKFKMVKLPPSLINKKIDEVDLLIDELSDFSMSVHNDAL